MDVKTFVKDIKFLHLLYQITTTEIFFLLKK